MSGSDFSAATVALGLQGVGAAASAYGAYSGAKAEQASLEYRAAVERNNAQYATWQAEDALTRGADEKQRHQLKVAQLKGTQRASLAARGIDLGEGSALDILSDTDFMGVLDANTIADNSAKEAWAFRNQAANSSANAGLYAMGASNKSPLLAGATSLLTGAGSVASSWYRMKAGITSGIYR